ncbi:MAG: twitching motility protein PilT [Deltaproteobacteria bacterium]|nr:twitching motility protein PilT [Deltaproteobacteria bacterium]
MTEVLYDAGALIAAERNDRAFWADHRLRLEGGRIPTVPATVVAQVSRSPRQAQLHRLIRGCQITELTESRAHQIGRVLSNSGSTDIVDASVVVEAAARRASIVTSDRKDIAHLLGGIGVKLTIIDV